MPWRSLKATPPVRPKVDKTEGRIRIHEGDISDRWARSVLSHPINTAWKQQGEEYSPRRTTDSLTPPDRNREREPAKTKNERGTMEDREDRQKSVHGRRGNHGKEIRCLFPRLPWTLFHSSFLRILVPGCGLTAPGLPWADSFLSFVVKKCA
uniref:Uncharacterized protein n=1 Tax=Candidatus Kentrum sp. MB TaxID=2138164 RepID=A0A450X7S2_9GAMM|nr:MAG: hypothetical protein BECKMB1821G_GA0114241_101244 [Candidatus Kentron sp. MB]